VRLFGGSRRALDLRGGQTIERKLQSGDTLAPRVGDAFVAAVRKNTNLVQLQRCPVRTKAQTWARSCRFHIHTANGLIQAVRLAERR